MKRILFLTENLASGGAERAAINLMHHLVKKGHAVSLLICGGPAEWDEQVPSSISRHYASSVACQPFRKTVLASAFKLWHLGRSSDIAIALHPNTAGLLYLMRPLLNNLRIIGWVHFDAGTYLPVASLPVRFSIRHAYGKMDACVFVSASSLKSMISLSKVSRGIQAAAKVIANIPTTNSTDTPSQNLDHIQTCREAGNAIVLHIGRLSAEKQPLHALQVSRLINGLGIRHKMFILGDGPLYHEVSNAAVDLPSVVVGGSESQVSECLRIASALILTSCFDNWPTVILEAMACGTPVIAYDVPGGIPAMLDNGRRGHLTAPTPKAMAEVLATVLTNPDQEFNRIAAALSFITEYKADRILLQWENLFNSLANSP